jgi:protein-L-isoaspartate O-methyltransferase
VLQALQLHDVDSVLAVGRGYGWTSEALSKAAKIRWIGLDPAEAIDKASPVSCVSRH